MAIAKTAVSADDFCDFLKSQVYQLFLCLRERTYPMLLSIALIFLCGMLLSSVFQKLRLPGLLGMLLCGILIGPHVLNLLAPQLLAISADLRKLALIIILSRAGLALQLSDLKRVGRPAVLLCFLPACLEILGVMLLAPRLLGVSLVDAALIGAVLAAVSPAIVVPKMLRLMEDGYGVQKGIPQMILASGSVDNAFVLVVFSAFIGLAQGSALTPISLLRIPVSIVLGLLVGALTGAGFAWFFRTFHLRDSAKVLLILSISCLLVVLENAISAYVPFSSVLAILCIGVMLLRRHRVVAQRLSVKFNKLWVAAEVVLFVLVGATVDLSSTAVLGPAAILLILGALLFRMAGVFCCVPRTPLSRRERLFCAIAYLPKATVQAVTGSIPLALGLPCGQLVLTVAVLSVLLAAPIGALGIERSYSKLLHRSTPTV